MTWTSEQIMQVISQHMLNECITDARLAELTGLEDRQIENSTLRLRRHGLIKVVEPGCYRITSEGIAAIESAMSLRSGPKNPLRITRIVRNTVRERVWRAMQIRKSFTLPELIGLAATGDEKDIESNIGKYVRALEQAGYLIRLQKRMRGSAITSNGFIRWRLDLERDTGPLAPIYRMGKQTVYDPNNGEEIRLTVLKNKESQPCG